MEPFHTADVDLAAFLRCRGIRYTEIVENPTNVELADFVFEPSEELFACVREWHDESSLRSVDAREFGRVRRMFFKTAQRHVRKRG